MLLAAIEAGGTKFVCGVGNAETGSLETTSIPTRDPDATFADVEAFFRAATRRFGLIQGIGIGSFGPIDLDPASPGYGRILRTPKPFWEQCDLIARARRIAAVPIELDTDVNSAALAEAAAAGPDISTLAYVTVGTGIGVGIIAGGKPLHGFGHPEAGHGFPRRHEAHRDFPGICPFHGDCYEGLASGKAVEAAWGTTSSHLPEDHPFWEVESHYLAQLCASLFLTVAPQRIVLGGGVMKQQRLFPLIRRKTLDLLAGYVAALPDMDAHILPPLCQEPSGLIGAYILAANALAANGRASPYSGGKPEQCRTVRW
ncbi:fructokinase [Novosphingobium endophyticum]|uniref:fructokinase n=1 Tax=Novosphingobium endophyticum TaxID=1955250 RepID=A0A916TVX7_9SPHN|nr:ROK family protein [Novosphingobium endophyticum]GGC14471.1 fructokinase [Novosphingobium endophyticum]